MSKFITVIFWGGETWNRRFNLNIIIFKGIITFRVPLIMKGDTKQQYRTPETTVFKLEVELAILIGSGSCDPLIPEDI